VDSDLVTSANGKLLRRQEGELNKYRYNYWAAPVGISQATSLVDNNATTNNPNNTGFTLDMLKDSTGSPITFNTSPYNSDGEISSYWLYSFQNGISYWDYIFEGKPNNGTILLSANDVGGPGSDPTAAGGYTRTEYLVGNPYASAIDAHQFINDNSGVIGGEIYLWEHCQ